jgi:hypothetical protein
VTARASVAPDLDQVAAETTAETATVEVTEEGALGQDLTPVAAAGIPAETTADTRDLAPATATTTTGVETDTTAAATAPADPEGEVATETSAEEILPLRREASLSTEEVMVTKTETPRSENHGVFYYHKGHSSSK